MCQTNIVNEEAKKIAEKFDGCTPVQSKMIAAEMKKRKKENISEEAKKIANKLDCHAPVHSQMIAAEINRK